MPGGHGPIHVPAADWEAIVTAAILGSQLSRCTERVNALLYESDLGVVFETMVPGRLEDYVAKFGEGIWELFPRMSVTFLA